MLYLVSGRILSDWLEGKLSGESESVGYERPPDGTLHTLCVSNSVYDTGEQTHSVHIGVKVFHFHDTSDPLFQLQEFLWGPFHVTYCLAQKVTHRFN